MNTGERIGQELVQNMDRMLYGLTGPGVQEARQREVKVIRCSCGEKATISIAYIPLCHACAQAEARLAWGQNDY